MRKGLRICIGPYVYRQRWVPAKVLEDTDADADSNHVTRQIRLADVVDHPRAVENLIHEVIEAVNAMHDLRLPHHKIQSLGLGLAQALGPLIKRWW